MSGLKPESITLSVYNRSATKFGVMWQTEIAGSPVLEYTDKSDINFTEPTTVTGICSHGMDLYKNCVILENIAANDEILWRVGDKSGIFSDIFTTKLPSLQADRLTFLVITDTQDEANNGTWLKFASEDAKVQYPDAELIIHTGDMVQEGGNTELWRLMLENNSKFFLSRPMAYVSGNHDYWEYYLYGNTNIAENHFLIDHPSQDTTHGIYYSFDCGPAHFTVLSSGDSMETDRKGLLEEQYNWSLKDISETNKKWKIVCIHNPLYSPGKYGCRPPLDSVALALREQFNEAFADLGVDLILCGHDHVYSQTFPMNRYGVPIKDYAFETAYENGKEIKIAISPEGPIHLESGCAGNQDRGIEPEISASELSKFEKVSAMTYGTVSYSAVEIKDEMLTVCYRKISVNTGECVEENRFGIKKHSL